ncbi:MAG: hypothetical protein C4325_09255 [Blastocatellia bacterium]
MDIDERSDPHLGDLYDWKQLSFLSGHQVIAAGMIWIDNGRPLQISDESGRYKPSKWEMAACVTVLVNHGIDPNSFSVFLFGNSPCRTATELLPKVQVY